MRLIRGCDLYPSIYGNYDKMFIDKLQIVLKSLLTCKIHKSALEYSIIRRYTNVVYYYYYYTHEATEEENRQVCPKVCKRGCNLKDEDIVNN